MNAEPLPLYVIGAGGMLAGEFLRLAESHPGLQLEAALARNPGPLAASHPHLSTDLSSCSLEVGFEHLRAGLDAGVPAVVVFALPHGESASAWRGLRSELGSLASRATVVDLSADYRLADAGLYEQTYGRVHPDPEELEHFVYGLVEHQRDRLSGVRRIAAPGCFATALQLATLPAARAGVLDGATTWIYHAVTGSSGSGNKPAPNTHHPHRDGNVWAYSTQGHRHEAELGQALASSGLQTSAARHFVAHSGPFVRGIHLSAALPLSDPLATSDALALYAQAYENDAFVEVLTGVAPDLRRVVGSNRASLGVTVRDSVLHVALTIDNLIKGGSGQALQALNIALGWPEETGLDRSAWGVS